MSTKKKQNVSDSVKKKVIKTIRKAIGNADRLIIGAGVGMSASAGLNYNDEDFFKEHFEVFYNKGYKTMTECMADHWYLTEDTAQKYWAYWALHIQNIFHLTEQLEAYRLLYDIIEDKAFFIITTNADGQFFKNKYDPKKVFAMQGSYGNFQCQKKCHKEVYDNKVMVEMMVENMDLKTLSIDPNIVPRCPNCGGLLSPNLRMDQSFVEGSSLDNRKSYLSFVNEASEKSVFLELGVGYNTPGIIKNPFEEMKDIFGAKLIRINKGSIKVPTVIEKDLIISDMDIKELLIGLKS